MDGRKTLLAPRSGSALKITIVVDRYYPHIGGIEQYVHGLCGQLMRDGHDISIITGLAPGAPESQVTAEGKVIRTPVLEGAVSKPGRVLARATDIARLLESTSPDVVYANNHASLGAVRGAQIAGLPVVYGCHGWGLMCPSRIRFLKHNGDLCESETGYKACMSCYSSGPAPMKVKLPGYVKQANRVRRYLGYHDILNSADARIGVSRLAASMFQEQRNTFAIHPGLDMKLYQPVDSTGFRNRFGVKGDYVLVPGRVNPIKGQMDALRAVAEMNSSVSLVFAGNEALDPNSKSNTGPYGRALSERADALGLSRRVIFTGMLSQPEMAQAYSGAVTTVVPSVWAEPFGYVAVESMACGTPIVITGNSGAAELVDDTVGQVVPRQDHVAIARALERVVPASERLGAAARLRVAETVAWPSVAAKVVSVLENATSAGSKLTAVAA